MTWMKTRQGMESSNRTCGRRQRTIMPSPGASNSRNYQEALQNPLFSVFLWSLQSTGPANITSSLQGGWSVATSTTALCSRHSVLLFCFMQPALILKLLTGCLPHQHSKHYNPGLTTCYWIRNQGAHLWEDCFSHSQYSLIACSSLSMGGAPVGINIFVTH